MIENNVVIITDFSKIMKFLKENNINNRYIKENETFRNIPKIWK